MRSARKCATSSAPRPTRSARKLDGELAQKIAAAEKLIGDAKAKSLADVRQVASDIAGEIVGELTGIKAAAGGCRRRHRARGGK